MKKSLQQFLVLGLILASLFNNFKAEDIQQNSNSTSFIQSTSHVEVDSKALSYAQLQHQNVLNLMALSKAAKNKRRTVDGRKCADSFNTVDNQTTIENDCTNKPSPDGQSTEEEWCEVDPNEGGTPSWGFCDPILDYDKVREKVRDLMAEEIPEIRKIKDEEEKLIPMGSGLLKSYQSIASKQSDCINKLGVLKDSIAHMETMYKFLMKLKDQWEEIQRKTVILEIELEELRKTVTDDRPENCEGILGYEDVSPGDGVEGFYYDNEDFAGSPIQHLDESINFDWDGEPPLEDINHENFSIRWQGYILAPVSGNYKFTTISDDGNSFEINKREIISHNMGTIRDSSLTWMDAMTAEEDSKKVLKTSNIVRLNGGTKYFFKMLVFHSVHNEHAEVKESFAKLKWESDRFSEQTVPPIKLYKSNKPPPLKVTGYFQDQFVLRTMQNYDDAYQNTQQFIMDDIPLQFENLQQLRAVNGFREKHIKIDTNVPTNIYIAVSLREPNPLESDYLDTQEVMSVLHVSKDAQAINGVIRAKDSIPFRIYKKSYIKGEIWINLLHPAKSTGLDFILFYGIDASGPKDPACGGEEVMISLQEEGYVHSCEASSEFVSGEYGCTYAFNGKMEDAPYSMWVSNGEGVAAWIEIRFKQFVQVTGISYKNRASPGERAKEIEVQYSDGSVRKHPVRNTDSEVKFKVNSTTTESLRFTIDSVYSSINNGGSFNILGIPCVEPEPKVDERVSTKIPLKCQHTISNNDLIQKRAYSVGDSFLAYCPDACIDLRDTLEFYGSMKYAEDSAICLSAFHAGAIQKAGGDFMIKIIPGLIDYQGETRNGIASKSRAGDPTGKALEYTSKPSDQLRILSDAFVGMLVDAYDVVKNLWVPGVVDEIKKDSQTDITLKINQIGLPPEMSFNAKWYDNKRVDYCGEKIKDRDDCNNDSKKPSDEKIIDVKFCFTPMGKCPDGYLLDSGLQYRQQQKDYQYGWGRDMTSNARDRPSQPDPLLRSFIMFPPDPESLQCTQLNPEVICDPVSWSLAVPIGRYDVKITVGDADRKIGYSMTVNKQYIFEDIILQPNQFMTESITVEASSGMITITSACDPAKHTDHCKQVWSRMSAVEVRTNIAKVQQKDDVGNDGTISLGCMQAFSKGRCVTGITPPVDCLYASVGDPGAEHCSGIYHLQQIPDNFNCKIQRNQYKCLKNDYDTLAECQATCVGKCVNLQCKVSNAVVPQRRRK